MTDDYLTYWQVKAPVFLGWDGRTGFYKSPVMVKAVNRILAYLRRTPSINILHGQHGIGKTAIAKHCGEQLSFKVWDLCQMTLMSEQNEGDWVIHKLAAYFGIYAGLDFSNKVVEVARHLDLLVEDNRKLCVVIDGADYIHSLKAMSGVQSLLQIQDSAHNCLSFVFISRQDFNKMLQKNNSFQATIGCSQEVQPWEYPDFKSFVDFAIHKSKSSIIDIPDEVLSSIFTSNKGVIGGMCSVLENLLIECFVQQNTDLTSVYKLQSIRTEKVNQEKLAEKSRNPKKLGTNIVKSATTRLDQSGSEKEEKRDIDLDEENIPLSALFKRNA